MHRLDNQRRVFRLIDEALDHLQVDLSGIRVLTEAASGAYMVTPLIAARAGAAGVWAVARSSAYGSAEEVMAYGREWANALGVADRIRFVDGAAADHAAQADVVTNLGFVRPIDASLVARLPRHAAVSLMWEPWEFRDQDVDAAACAAHGIPIIATNEHDPRLRLFEYVGVLAVKLLLEAGIEILRSRVLIVGSDPFGAAVEAKLAALGAETRRVIRSAAATALDDDAGDYAARADAIVVAEHRDHREMIGDNGGIRPERFAAGCRLVHVAGRVDEGALARVALSKHPARLVPPGFMTLATDYVGSRPVIELHAAGLKVGADVARSRMRGCSIEAALAAAEQSGLGLRLPPAAVAPLES